MHPSPKDPAPGGSGLFHTAAVLAGILALAAFLRLDGLGEPSLWLDEILHVEAARAAADEPLGAWLSGLSADRENGPLFYALQLLGQGVAPGEVGVRLLPALIGIASVALLFLTAFVVTGSRWVAASGALLLAVSPLHVYYSREGRPYAAVMLLVVLLLLLALRRRREGLRVAAPALAVAAAYLGALTAPVLISGAALGGVDALWRKRNRILLLACGAGLGATLLLFPAAERLGNAAGGANPTARWQVTDPLSVEASDRLLASFTVSGVEGGSASLLSLVFLAVATWGGLALARRDRAAALWVVGLCLLPVAGWLAALTLLDHWYNVRYTSVGLPAFLLLTAVGLVDLVEHLPRKFAGALVVVGLGVLTVPGWQAARSEPWEKPDWRGMASLVETLALPGEPVIARGPWAATCLDHYLAGAGPPRQVLEANYDPAAARRWALEHGGAWVLSAGYRETPEFDAWARTLDPISRSSRANLRLWFSPDFSTLVADPRRLPRLHQALRLTGVADPGQDFAGSELLLGGGWSYPERTPEGGTFRWAQGARAELALAPASRATQRRLRLRWMPFPSPDRGPQEIRVEVNGRPLTELRLEPGWSETVLPPWTSSRPLDLLTFHFAWHQSPRELDPASGDPRSLAAAFDFAEALGAPLLP